MKITELHGQNILWVVKLTNAHWKFEACQKYTKQFLFKNVTYNGEERFQRWHLYTLPTAELQGGDNLKSSSHY